MRRVWQGVCLPYPDPQNFLLFCFVLYGLGPVSHTPPPPARLRLATSARNKVVFVLWWGGWWVGGGGVGPWWWWECCVCVCVFVVRRSRFVHMAWWPLLLPVFGLCCGAGATPTGPVVIQTNYGPVVGAPSANGTVAFLGIPFAAPPVGPLRWSSPAAPSPWVSPRNATTQPPACIQAPNGFHTNTR